MCWRNQIHVLFFFKKNDRCGYFFYAFSSTGSSIPQPHCLHFCFLWSFSPPIKLYSIFFLIVCVFECQQQHFANLRKHIRTCRFFSSFSLFVLLSFSFFWSKDVDVRDNREQRAPLNCHFCFASNGVCTPIGVCIAFAWKFAVASFRFCVFQEADQKSSIV